MKRLFFVFFILSVLTSISYAVPPTPATLPNPEWYTAQQIQNSVFEYPDAWVVIARSSDTYSIKEGTMSVTFVKEVYGVLESSSFMKGGYLDGIRNGITVYITTVTVKDDRYEGKVSTGTNGVIFASADITPSGSVYEASFYADGGNATITSTYFGGTAYLLEGIPLTIPAIQPIATPIFQCVLTTGNSIYYWISEVK